ncbi:AAA family ATPase [Anabaena subtropica]|uniref:AAA family ATPase n=1 Tax=Anabaena subtropica FACHB-260 TaxID=2692884 RepID=A0ABR8CSI7_9NOST|nr:AAA family ATPase [Anabaena subtropica]MBD2346172.1 AAA family ATPase [Anabaena subtropica FACHB-260]
MNTTPRPPTFHLPEFQQIIEAKSHNFVGREFVFTAIHDFIHRYPRGYFTIIGAPGSGKSAILAKYALDNPDVFYYNVEIAGKNRTDEFLRNICTQLLETRETSLQNIADNATEGSWFLSLLLQQISEQLQPNQKLIIAIDGLNFIDRNLQPPGANLFYLPRYLPDGVYFLLTRRPFLREKSGLLIEAPFQSLDLGDYPEENRRDIEAYIWKNLTPLTPLPYEGRGGQETGRGGQENYSPLLAGEGLGEGSIRKQEFSTRLITESENNFMYTSQILSAIAEGFYPEPFSRAQLPPSLEAYYQQNLQQMIPEPMEDFSLAVLGVLVQQPSVTVEAIAHTIDADEYDVEEVLENWMEFLQQQQITGVTHYSLYHSSFRQWCQNNL